MAVAAVIDNPNEEPHVAQYRAVLEQIDTLKATLQWWDAALDTDTPLDLMLKALQAEMDQAKLDWVHIAPKEFALSQSRVQAIERILAEVKEKHQGAREQLRSAMHLKQELEFTYEAILRSEGFEFGAPEPPENSADEPEAEASSEDADEPDDQADLLEEPAEDKPKRKRK